MRHEPREIAAIFAGGFIGAMARAELVEAFPAAAGEWPWATFIANVAGTFLLGAFVVLLQERLPRSTYRLPLLGTGFCGALTTFSTFQIETLELARDGDVGLAILYPVVSIAAGMAVAIAGVLVARWGRHW